MSKLSSYLDGHKEVQEAAEIFLKAADYIRQYGWQEKGMAFHGQPRCSMGALTSAAREKVLSPHLSSLMYQALYQELGGMNLTEFNAQAKSGKEVAALFEKTAESLSRTER